MIKGEPGFQQSPGSLFSIVDSTNPKIVTSEFCLQKYLLLYSDKGGIRSQTIARIPIQCSRFHQPKIGTSEFCLQKYLLLYSDIETNPVKKKVKVLYRGI